MRGEETVINHSYSIERYCMIKHCIAICLTLYIVDFMVYVIVFIKVIRGKLLLETKYIYIPVFFYRVLKLVIPFFIQFVFIYQFK